MFILFNVVANEWKNKIFPNIRKIDFFPDKMNSFFLTKKVIFKQIFSLFYHGFHSFNLFSTLETIDSRAFQNKDLRQKLDFTC